MFCPNCGKQIPDDVTFCPECGENVALEENTAIEKNTDSAESGYQTSSMGTPQINPQKQTNKKMNKTTVIIISGVLIVVILCAGIGMALRMNSQNNAEEAAAYDTSSSESDSETTDEYADTNSEEYSEEDSELADETAANTAQSAKVISASDVSLNVSDIQPADLPSFQKVNVISTNATSTVAQAGYDNSSAQLIDGRDETSWQEGVDGDGIGESVTLTFAQPQKVKYIGLKLGNWRDGSYYTENNVPSSLNIRLGDVSSTLNFSSDKVQHWVSLSDESEASTLTLTIEGVYSGTDWQDTCIAEVVVYGE